MGEGLAASRNAGGEAIPRSTSLGGGNIESGIRVTRTGSRGGERFLRTGFAMRSMSSGPDLLEVNFRPGDRSAPFKPLASGNSAQHTQQNTRLATCVHDLDRGKAATAPGV